MCGILYWNIAKMDEDQIDVIHSQVQRLHHRGPDSSNIQVHQEHLLGFHRLAIINPTECGDQPMIQDSTCLICNGEIYNYKQLAEKSNTSLDSLPSDVAVIPNVLQNATSLAKGLCSLDGDFAFVMLNRDEHHSELVAARDPIGLRPLFFGKSHTGDICAFASEVKALIGGPKIESVHRFPPGHFWTSSTGFVEYTNIYNKSTRFFCKDQNMAQNAVRTLLTEAVRKRIEHTDRPLAFLCSGGVDSCIILALAYQILCEMGRAEDMMAFSMQYDSHGSGSDDAMYAALFLQQLGVLHKAVKFEKEDISKWYREVVRVCESYDPNTIRAALPMFLLAKHIAENTDYKVLLSGEVSDEIMLGYNYFLQVPDAISANAESTRLIKNMHSFDLLRADRVFAAHGLEIRVPFADRDFLRFMFQTDAKLRSFQDGVEKALLRKAFSDIECLQHVLWRPKERASDGVGFQYVPHLFDFVCKEKDVITSDLAEKEETERHFCRETFESFYGKQDELIISRSMPAWCKKASTELLSS